MAAVAIGALAPELEGLLASLGGGGAAGLVGRVGASALGGVAASQLIGALKGAHPAAKHKVPRFALVDLHNDMVITTLSARRAYRLLIRPRRRALRSKVTREIIVERGDRYKVP